MVMFKPWTVVTFFEELLEKRAALGEDRLGSISAVISTNQTSFGERSGLYLDSKAGKSAVQLAAKTTKAAKLIILKRDGKKARQTRVQNSYRDDWSGLIPDK